METKIAMNNKATGTAPKSQSDKFKEAAREHEADEDEKRWEDRLKRVVKAKPPQDGPKKP